MSSLDTYRTKTRLWVGDAAMVSLAQIILTTIHKLMIEYF